MIFYFAGMKRETSPIGSEYFSFGIDNKLRIFPPNTYKFKPRDHIVLDDIQECILDNFWFQYNNKREDKGYMVVGGIYPRVPQDGTWAAPSEVARPVRSRRAWQDYKLH